MTIELVAGTSPFDPNHVWSSGGLVSSDGRYVAFTSWATNLGPLDTNNQPDAYLKDMQTGAVWLINSDSAGVQGTGRSTAEAISAVGHSVAFHTDSPNLVGNFYSSAYVVKNVWTGDLEHPLVPNIWNHRAGELSYSPTLTGDSKFAVLTGFLTTSDMWIRNLATGADQPVSRSATAWKVPPKMGTHTWGRRRAMAATSPS